MNLRRRPIERPPNTMKKAITSRETGTLNERWSTQITLMSFQKQPMRNRDESGFSKPDLVARTESSAKLPHCSFSCTSELENGFFF
jgi:hypothetical protein